MGNEISSTAPKRTLESYTPEEVAGYVRGLADGLEGYADNFVKFRVDGAMICYGKEEELGIVLTDIGVTTMVHQVKLLAEARKHRSESMAALTSTHEAATLQPTTKPASIFRVPSEGTASLLECCICLEPMDDPISLLCGHSGCLLCLKQTFDMGKLTCPMCNTSVSSEVRANMRPNIVIKELIGKAYPHLALEREQARAAKKKAEEDAKKKAEEDARLGGLQRYRYRAGFGGQPLNVREGPDLDSPIVRQINAGDEITCLLGCIQIKEGSLRVRLADGSGWTGLRLANGQPLLDPVEVAIRPPMTHPTGLGFTPQKYLVRPGYRVYTRKGLDMTSDVVKNTFPGDIIECFPGVIQNAEGLFRARLLDGSGYTLLKTKEGHPLMETVGVRYRVLAFVGAPLKLRTGPELSSTQLRLLGLGEEIVCNPGVVKISEGSLRVRLLDGSGWTSLISSSGAQILERIEFPIPVPEPPAPLPDRGTFVAQSYRILSVNGSTGQRIRKEPDLESGEVRVHAPGDVLTCWPGVVKSVRGTVHVGLQDGSGWTLLQDANGLRYLEPV